MSFCLIITSNCVHIKFLTFFNLFTYSEFLIFLFLLKFKFLLWCLISFCICGFPWATRPCTCPLCLFTSYSELLLLPFSPFGLLFLAATFHELPRVFLLLFKVFSNVLCAVKRVFLQRFLWLWSRSLLSVLFNLWQDIPKKISFLFKKKVFTSNWTFHFQERCLSYCFPLFPVVSACS